MHVLPIIYALINSVVLASWSASAAQELAFLNASAALSPLTNTVKAVKSLIPDFGFGKKK